MSVIDDVKLILGDALLIGERAQAFDASTPLWGSLPEFDSMALLEVRAAIEERFDMIIDDDDITGEVFETVGSLSDFVSSKIAA